MTTDALLDLTTLTTGLQVAGHLPECSDPRGPVTDCGWCRWAIETKEIRLLRDLHHDARALSEVDSGTVPWVIATNHLLRTAESIDLDRIHVPSVRNLAEQVRRPLRAELTQLRERLRAAVASNGPVEQRCLLTAGRLAAAAIQAPGFAAIVRALPTAAQQKLTHASNTLSVDTQVASLLPAIEDVHRQSLPRLRTQPEWQLRSSGTLSARQTGKPGATVSAIPPAASGSLEALVVESASVRVAALLSEVANDLCGLAPPVAMSRPANDVGYSSEARRVMWRVARIDWHLTFVDTGRADCWNARIEEDQIVTEVPWQVAAAIEVAKPHRLVSATHQARPTYRRTYEAN
jgi:hypothetical protein